MDFFKSVFSDDPEPPTTEPKFESLSEPKSPKNNPQHEDKPDRSPPPNPNPSFAGAAGGWSFGGLIQTLSAKSESVLETYRRDLHEFGSGLKKELEVAQGSLGTVSTTIDEIGSTVLKGTAQIISQGKEALLAVDQESDSSDNNLYASNSNNLSNSGQQKKYSRFDAQVRAIQGDASTYCEEVDDLDDYKKWKSGFLLDSVSEEIERFFEENGAMESIYQRVVPNSVDHETFWCRYFYRVYKLKQAEDLRANLVKRAFSREEDEDLSWDVDDEDEDETESNVAKKVSLKESGTVNIGASEKSDVKEGDAAVKGEVSEKDSSSDKVSEQVVKEESLRGGDEKGEKVSKSDVDEVGKGNVAESSENVVNEKVVKEKIDGMNKESVGLKSDEKVSLAAKTDPSESSKGSDFLVVSSQPSMHEEEDLGWDEIEDLSSIDDKKVTHGGSPNRADLRKRLSTTEEEEDLSWDIEDDDEPDKS